MLLHSSISGLFVPLLKRGMELSMFKVFLVEDEIVVREGIKNNINWEEEGFKIVGDESDGELAYPMIIREQPDILHGRSRVK